MAFPKSVWVFLGIVALIGACWIFYGANRRSRYIVQFEIPDGFRGVITIRKDPNGVAPTVKGKRGGRTVAEYVVPPDGVILTNDVNAFTNWHRVAARYRSGETLPALGFDSSNQDQVLFRELTGFGGRTRNEFVAYCLVGTAEEANAFHADHKVWSRVVE
jgi:hypothetical protein